jgi:hypothetical protein
MRGRGTWNFLNSKFAGYVPNVVVDDDDYDDDGGIDGGGMRGTGSSSSTSTSTFVRRGRTFETAYLTSRGRIIDRILVLYFGNGNGNGKEEDDDDDDFGSRARKNAEDAFLITSPGNDGDETYDTLSRTIFPMDGVSLTRYDRGCDGGVGVITIACSTTDDARSSFVKNGLDDMLLDGCNGGGGAFAFPDDGTCDHYRVSRSYSSTAEDDRGRGGGAGGGRTSYADVYAFGHTFLSSDICRGYTLLFVEGESGGRVGRDDHDDVGGIGSIGGGTSLYEDVWRMLVDENNDVGPVGIGHREYETLRIEAGLPGYGNEMTGDGGPTRGRGGEDDVVVDDIDGDDVDVDDAASSSNYRAKSNPLELHLRDLIDVDKGCYQGQEGVASVLKNKRGPPRQLYQVAFYDSENDFHGNDDDDDDDAGFGLLSTDNEMLTEFRKLKGSRRRRRRRDAGGSAALANDTRQPRPGDDIYVLGSNDSILVGKISEFFPNIAFLSSPPPPPPSKLSSGED